ncbi:MobA/MobL family protein [Halovulum sp. GXIMD14793]
MAIFHVSHKTVGRSTHAAGTAGAHADYIEREKACRIAFGEHMPTKRGETRRWLDEQEAGDRKNARVIDKLTLALPLELDAQQRVDLVRAFVEELSEGKPVPWLAAIHDNEQDADNPHCHLIIRDRHVETGKRAIGMSEKGSTERARETWERAANTFLLQAGSNERIDRRSLKAQRAELLAEEPKYRKYQPELADEMLARAEALDRKPQGHEGPQSREIERKGRHSEKLERIRNARQGVTEAPQPSQGVTEAPQPSQGVTIRSKEDRLRRRREKQSQQRVQLERTLDNGPEPNDPPLWGSVREAFKDIISPAGWRGTLWQVLAHFKLVGDWVELNEINDELREQAVSKFEAKPQSIRQKILNALNLPLEPQVNELTPQKPVPEKLEKPEQPKPRPKSGWSGPSDP